MYTERKWTNYEKISKKLIKKKLVQAGSTSLGSGKNKKDKKRPFFSAYLNSLHDPIDQ